MKSANYNFNITLIELWWLIIIFFQVQLYLSLYHIFHFLIMAFNWFKGRLESIFFSSQLHFPIYCTNPCYLHFPENHFGSLTFTLNQSLLLESLFLLLFSLNVEAIHIKGFDKERFMQWQLIKPALQHFYNKICI